MDLKYNEFYNQYIRVYNKSKLITYSSINFLMISAPDLKRNLPQTKKQRLFRIFHTLSYDFNTSPYLYCTLLIFEMLQLVYFAIHPSCCTLWPIKFTSIMQGILGYLNTHLIWENTSVSFLFGCCLALVIVYALAACTIIYEINSQPRKSTTTFHQIKIKLLQYLSMLSRTVLVMPVTLIMAFIIKNCLFRQSFLEVFSIAIATCLCLLYAGISYLFLQLHIDNSPFSKLPWAGPANFNEKYKQFFKIMVGIMTAVLPNQCDPKSLVIYEVFMAIFVVFLLFLMYQQYSEPNLVSNAVRCVYQHSLMTIFSIYLMLIFRSQIIQSQNISLLFITIYCILSNLAWSVIKKYRQRSLSYSVYKSLTSKKQILSYNYLLCQYIRDFSTNPLYLIKLQGILSDHVMNCKKLDEICKCRILKQKLKQFTYEGNLSQIRQQTEGWFGFIKSNLIMNLQKMNFQSEFNLMLSQIQHSVLMNKFMAYVNLQKCVLKKSNLSIQFLIFNQKRIIERSLLEQDIKKNEKKQVDVNKFLQMSNQIGLFQQKILKSSLQHLQFWTVLSNETSRKKSMIMKEGSNLLVTVKECEKMYKNITYKYPNNLESIILFSNYSKYILNDHELILKNRNLFNLIRKKLIRSLKVSSEQQKQKYSQNAITGTIIISGQKHNVGIIKACSSKMTHILKYAGYELVGQNINTLMPNFIGNMHNEVLMKYLDQSQSQFDFAERYVTVIDKNNFLILGRVMTKPLPNLINGLELLGILQKIRQHHIRHGQQTPKYVLYRCDTGKVEALSESFYNQYGYRLTKLNQYSQVSEELNFSSLFNGIPESAITNTQEGIECEIKTKKGLRRTAKARVYIRHQFYYFGVKVKLLYLFSNESSFSALATQAGITMNPMMINTMNTVGQDKHELEVPDQSTPQENKSDVQKNNISHDEQIKKLKSKMPFKFLVFRVLLVFLLVLVITSSILQFILSINQTKLMKNFLSQSQNIYNSQEYLINVGYYSRMMQLSSAYPSALPQFQQFKSNLSVYTKNLQQMEFQLVNQEAAVSQTINFKFEDLPLSWQISPQQIIFSSQSTLSLNIFDLVTSASTFGSATPSSFNFSFDLASDIASKDNIYYRNLFKIRYSILYQLLESKQNYSKKITSAYNDELSRSQKLNQIEIIVACILISTLLIVMLRILYLIMTSIFSITVLFNWLTPSQINKEISQCQNFLEHFFINEYEVVLRLKKSEISTSQSFEQTGKAYAKLLNTTTYNDLGELSQLNVNQKGNSNQYENIRGLDGDGGNQIDLVKMSAMNIKDKDEKKVKNEEGEDIPLKNQEDSSQQINEEDQANKQSILMNFRTFLPTILSCLFFLVYALSIFEYSVYTMNLSTNQIYYQNLINENIESLNKLKYYGLETALDSSSFQNYQNLNVYFNNIYHNVYELQENLSKFSEANQNEVQKYLYNQMLNGICKRSFQQTISFSIKSFDTNQCKAIDKGILNKGLRAALIAYIQNIANSTNFTTPQNLASSSSFQKVIQMDKYIKSSLVRMTLLNEQLSERQINLQVKISIIWFCLMILSAFGITIIVNTYTSSDIMSRISGTFQIISLIPSRIFTKNENLYAEYRKNVEKLLQ